MAAAPTIPSSFSGIPWTHGMSGAVYFISEQAVVKRAMSDDASKTQLSIERQIYDRLGLHPSITALLGSQQDMVILERLRYTLRHRLHELRGRDERPASADKIRWALQIAEGLQYIHSRGVKQVDIGTYNVLLDWQDNAKLSDFAGSSLDGSEPTVAPGAHATHPRLSVSNPSVHSELFALGSLLYEMETTYQALHDKNDGELEELFGTGQFPPTDDLLLGEIMKNCWTVAYSDASEVITDIQLIQDRVRDGGAQTQEDRNQFPQLPTP